MTQDKIVKYAVHFTWQDYGSDCLRPNYGYWNGRNMFGTDDDAVLFDTEAEAQAVIGKNSDEYDYGSMDVWDVEIIDDKRCGM